MPYREPGSSKVQKLRKEPSMRKNILFEHNQKAYKAAVSMIEQTGKAAVIHPTGTGKSFLGFQLCADQKDQRICWLSPSEYIYRTQMEKWLLAGGEEIKNLCFMTYAKLMRLKEQELNDLKPSYLILDEFHRLGAVQWGSGVERLREKYPNLKILGLSATNIRYLDNQRDMAWELFGGNIASNLTLGESIAQGILPAPKYVLSVYSCQKELRRYEARVSQARNKALREKAEQELQALRRTLEKADGLTEVFAKHMASKTEKMAGNHARNTRLENGEKAKKGTEKESSFYKNKEKTCGKYIVFCASYEHLLEMKELAPEWFARVDPAPHIYTAYSEDPMTAEEFESFKNDNSDHLKLLYCIDMLNEGIHVDGLSGVILLRPTVSPTIYKQQIGRALAAGGKETPVIFDIVMNIENLCSIGAIEEELREAVLFYRANGRAGEIVKEQFQIVDELGDCRRLFAQLNETLGASWDAMYAMAKEYYTECGNLEVPKYYTMDGYSLGAWIATQRKIYLGKTAGSLSEEQIARLTKIGMRWKSTSETVWERNFAQAEKYFREHGNLEVPVNFVTESGCKLGRWVRRQREKYQTLNQKTDTKDNKKSPETIQSETNAKDDKKSPEMIQSKTNAKDDKKSPETIQSKTDAKDNKKSPKMMQNLEQIRKLTEIGMVWEPIDSWEKRFALAEQYYKEHGNLRMPNNYVVEGVWLERWLREQKARIAEEMESSDGKKEKKHRRPLNEKQKQKLISIGVQIGMSQAERSWREQYREAEEFYHKYGNLAVPKRYVAENRKNLGVWLQHQRANYRSGKLADWQIQMLDEIGMVWKVTDSWEQGIVHAKKYFLANRNLLVPHHYICSDGYRLGKWISNQRLAYSGLARKGLREEQIQQLEGFGMIWNAKQGRRRVQ